MENNFVFSDSIEIIMDNQDILLFTPVYSNSYGLYLSCENDKPINNITLINSKLMYYYVDGTIKQSLNSVLSLSIDDTFLKKRIKSGILGNLLKYSYEDALIFDLDVNKSFDNDKYKTRKRSM